MTEAASASSSSSTSSTSASSGASRSSGAEGAGSPATASDKGDVTRAADAAPAGSVQSQAVQVGKDASNPDSFDPAGGVATSTGTAARSYGNLDVTGGRGLEGTNNTPKVQAQMRLNPTTALPDNHGFPKVADNHAAQGKSFAFVGGDGKVRSGIETPGSYNGKNGTFQWTVEPNKDVNHRLFVSDQMKNPIPRSSIIPGTSAARLAGRALLPLGAALDAHAIATSDHKVRTATEKAGAWAGSFGAAGAAASAAAPLLAAGPPGWVGYGAAVLGAGALGYFGGEKLVSSVWNWFS